jgi:hypothetical protein
LRHAEVWDLRDFYACPAKEGLKRVRGVIVFVVAGNHAGSEIGIVFVRHSWLPKENPYSQSRRVGDRGF